MSSQESNSSIEQQQIQPQYHNLAHKPQDLRSLFRKAMLMKTLYYNTNEFNLQIIVLQAKLLGRGLIQRSSLQFEYNMDRQTILDSTGQDDINRIFKIQLTNRSIRVITPLKQYQKLRYLNLSYNLIDKIQNLQALNDLRELHLENNSIDRISGLENNKNLQVLNLANNRIEKIENVAHLIKLETLNLNNNNISKLTGLQYLKELKTLSVCKNNLESIESLPTFSKLSTLQLSDNNIKAISNNLFMSSKALTALNLSNNKIVSTLFLQHLFSLEILDLSQNCIGELEVPTMPNLQSLNISHNEIDKLPSIAVFFPELIALNISHNSICSEIQLLSGLGDTMYLTELDFRENPMFSETFESALQKIHCFDYLNNKIMTKAGAKYYQKISEIKADLDKNQEIYGQDDERDREIKMSGFFDEELEFQMTGLRSTRPAEQNRKKNLQKPTFYDDIHKTYHEITINQKRIKSLRQFYLKTVGQYNIQTQPLITAVPEENLPQQKKNSEDIYRNSKKKQQIKYTASQQFQISEAQIKKDNQRNLSKWKQLKNKQKTFKIRDVIKSRGRDASVNRGHGSSTNTNWISSTSTITSGNGRQNREKSQLIKTQMLPRKIEESGKTLLRPSSMRKKE